MLSRYGRREWLIASVIALIAMVSCALFKLWWLAVPVALAWFAFLVFFRDPPRRPSSSIPETALLSPADGRVIAVEPVFSHAATDGPAVIVRLYLSLLNMHVNRMPCAVEVEDRMHSPGEHVDARVERSAFVNENALIIARRTNEPIVRLGVRQIAGKVGRRIVCPVQPGDRLSRGERFGMIKFGSSTELIVPRTEGMTIEVEVGDHVRAGETVLAIL
ncbi:MAG: phosphatidylserine decarboxylase [Planctomycetota bacterium]